MSFSIDFFGTPNDVVKELKQHANKLEGLSKQEYEAAVPALISLVELNHNFKLPIAINLVASGHGDGTTYNFLNVSLQNKGEMGYSNNG